MATGSTPLLFRWIAGSGVWTDVNNWNIGAQSGTPGPNDFAILPAAANQQYSIDGDASVQTISVGGQNPGGGTVTLGGTVDVSGNLVMGHATVEVGGALTIGGVAIGNFIVDGRLLFTTASKSLSLDSVAISPGGSVQANYLNFGGLKMVAGTSVKLTGYNNRSGGGFDTVGFRGFCSIAGGTLDATAGNASFGFVNAGAPTTVIASNGATVTDANLAIGQPGLLTVTGAGTTWRDVGGTGFNNTGDLTLSGGASSGVTASVQITDYAVMSEAGKASIGYDTSVTNRIVVSRHASWTVGSYELIGVVGNGSVRITSGATASAGAALGLGTMGVYLGQNAGSTGVLTVVGIGSRYTELHGVFDGYNGNGNIVIGNGGSAAFGDGVAGLSIGENGGTGSLIIGNTASVAVNGDVSIGARGELYNSFFSGVTISGGLQLASGSIVNSDTRSRLLIGGTGSSQAGAITIAAGGKLTGAGEVIGTIVNKGLITASGGTLNLAMQFPTQTIGGGQYAIDDGARLVFGGAVVGTQIVQFASGPGQTGTLQLSSMGSSSIDAFGFGAGDSFIVSGESGPATIATSVLAGAKTFALAYADGHTVTFKVEGAAADATLVQGFDPTGSVLTLGSAVAPLNAATIASVGQVSSTIPADTSLKSDLVFGRLPVPTGPVSGGSAGGTVPVTTGLTDMLPSSDPGHQGLMSGNDPRSLLG